MTTHYSNVQIKTDHSVRDAAAGRPQRRPNPPSTASMLQRKPVPRPPG
jgi:hypothetical protein